MTTDNYWTLHRGLVPRKVTAAARRRLLLELRRCGVTPGEIQEWASNSWWPSLRSEPEFDAVRKYLDPFVRSGDLWAETQILIRLPDEDGTQQGGYHTDTLPPWAEHMKYRAIFGVELTSTPPKGGGTVVWDRAVDRYVSQHAGDVLEMGPQLLHAGSPNLSANIRTALFFRLLKQPDVR